MRVAALFSISRSVTLIERSGAKSGVSEKWLMSRAEAPVR